MHSRAGGRAAGLRAEGLRGDCHRRGVDRREFGGCDAAPAEPARVGGKCYSICCVEFLVYRQLGSWCGCSEGGDCTRVAFSVFMTSCRLIVITATWFDAGGAAVHRRGVRRGVLERHRH
jgi:hypothetical protein